MLFRKNKLGFKGKPRPMHEIEAEYGRLAGLAGHKYRLARELSAEADEHWEEMSRLSKESVEAKALADLEKTKDGPSVNPPSATQAPIHEPDAPAPGMV